MKNLRIAALLASASMLAATSALAADVGYTQEEIASKFDLAFGIALTTQYVSRGVPQSDGFALQGYVEASYDWAYVGIWASNVGPTGFAPDSVEYDIYGGVRPTFGNLTVDLGYAHYFYNVTGSWGGEVYLKPSYQFTDWFTAGAEIYYLVSPAPAGFSYGEINAAFTLPYDFTLSGAVGTNFAGNMNWNAGVSYTFADTVTLDARVHGHTTNGTRIVGTLSLDTALSKLMK